jgi:hypothetical protein
MPPQQRGRGGGRGAPPGLSAEGGGGRGRGGGGGDRGRGGGRGGGFEGGGRGGFGDGGGRGGGGDRGRGRGGPPGGGGEFSLFVIADSFDSCALLDGGFRGRGGPPGGGRGGPPGARAPGQVQAPPYVADPSPAKGGTGPKIAPGVKTVGVPRPQARGTLGTPLTVTTNNFAVTIPEATFHHYDGLSIYIPFSEILILLMLVLMFACTSW